jgi:hypothetical protein
MSNTEKKRRRPYQPTVKSIIFKFKFKYINISMQYSSSFSFNYYFNFIKKLADKYWFVPLLLVAVVKVVLLNINNLKNFIIFMVIFYTIFIITTNRYKQVLDGINLFFNTSLKKTITMFPQPKTMLTMSQIIISVIMRKKLKKLKQIRL